MSDIGVVVSVVNAVAADVSVNIIPLIGFTDAAIVNDAVFLFILEALSPNHLTGLFPAPLM